MSAFFRWSISAPTPRLWLLDVEPDGVRQEIDLVESSANAVRETRP